MAIPIVKIAQTKVRIETSSKSAQQKPQDRVLPGRVPKGRLRWDRAGRCRIRPLSCVLSRTRSTFHREEEDWRRSVREWCTPMGRSVRRRGPQMNRDDVLVWVFRLVCHAVRRSDLAIFPLMPHRTILRTLAPFAAVLTSHCRADSTPS